MRRGWLAGALVALVASLAHAVPLTQEELTRLCGEAEGLAHCGRLVEAEQMKRLPDLAVRDGDTLTISLFPKGSVSFRDVDTTSGGKSYALWDFLSEINAAVLWTTSDDNAGFLLLQRATGRQTTLPSQPVLSPDRQRIATTDFCESRCENALAVWRVTRDGVRRESEWKPTAAWSDAAVRWKDAETLVIEYTAASATATTSLERKLSDPGWVRR